MGQVSANILVLALAARMACGAVGPDEVTLAKPPSVRVELADGRKLVGAVERFDDERFEGPIGRVRWVELAPVEAFRVRKILAAPKDRAGEGRRRGDQRAGGAASRRAAEGGMARREGAGTDGGDGEGEGCS